MLTAIRKWVISQMVKSDPSGVVKTLPKQDLIELNTQITANRLMTNGIDPNALQNANQVDNAINQIEAMEKANLANNIRTSGVRTVERGKVFDMEGKEIPRGSEIMGGKEVPGTSDRARARQRLKDKYGFTDERLDEIDNTQITEADEKMIDDMLKQDDERIIKEKLEAQNKKGIEGLKQKMAKEKARTERISGNLRAENLQRYDIGKPKLDEDEYDYYREILDDDENFVVKGDETKEQLEAMVKEQEAEVAYMRKLYDKGALDETPAEKAAKEKQYKKDYEGFVRAMGGLPIEDPIKKEYLKSVKEGKFKNVRLKDGREIKSEDDFREYIDELNEDNNFDFASGGRVGLFMGGPSAGPGLIRQLMRYFSGGTKSGKKGSEIMQMMNPKSYEKLLNDPAIYTKFNIKEGLGGPDMVKNMQRQASKDRLNMVKDFLGTAKRIKKADDDLIKYKEEVKEGLMKNVGLSEEEAEIAAQRLSRMAEDMAGQTSKRTPKITEEGILGLENILKNMETGGKKARELNAVGGRIGYKVGSIDKARRAFLKLLGAGAATTAAVKSGLIGLTKKGKVAKEIVKTKPVAGKPEWFDKLVNRVILEGDDVTKQFATKDREVVHSAKLGENEGVRVHRDLDEGTVRVEYDSPTNMGEDTVVMEFKPGMADETTKGQTPPDEFRVSETEPQYVGGPEDSDIEFVGEGGGSSIKMLESDVTALKEFAGEKITTKDLVERIKKNKRVQAINNDQMEQAEFISGKYGDGPEPDFDDIADFASGGIARMLGE